MSTPGICRANGRAGLAQETRRAARGDALLIPDPDLRRFAAGATIVPEGEARDKVRGVVFRPMRREEIPRDLRRYRGRIVEDGFIWVVIPKKAEIETLGRDVTFED